MLSRMVLALSLGTQPGEEAKIFCNVKSSLSDQTLYFVESGWKVITLKSTLAEADLSCT